jgi:hypothetical protein
MDGPSSAGPAGPSTTVADVIVPKGTFGSNAVSTKKKRRAKESYIQQISDEHAALVLGQGHPKSQPMR